MPNVKKGAVFALLLFLLDSLIIFTPGTVFASSGNWVEVTRFSAHGDSVTTEPFTCDYAEWRIRWEFDPGHWHFPQLHTFSVTTYPQGEDTVYVDQIYEMANGSKTGTHYIHENDGKFYIKISLGIIDGYTIIVEQNIDSIPEFQPWIVLSIAVTTTLIAVAAKRRRL